MRVIYVLPPTSDFKFVSISSSDLNKCYWLSLLFWEALRDTLFMMVYDICYGRVTVAILVTVHSFVTAIDMTLLNAVLLSIEETCSFVTVCCNFILLRYHYEMQYVLTHRSTI